MSESVPGAQPPAEVRALPAEVLAASWLVVPLYNEDRVIREVMSEALRSFLNIVCVDDGSSDDSAAEARAAGVHLVRHPVNLGQGAALRTGHPSCSPTKRAHSRASSAFSPRAASTSTR